MPGYVRRGEVVVVCLDPTVGTEIRKSRPCVVVSNDVANEVSSQVTVVPATAHHEKKARLPVCVPIRAGEGGLNHASIVVCSHLRTIDKARIAGRALGRVSDDTLRGIERAIKIHLALS